jgi:hypothetical protein
VQIHQHIQRLWGNINVIHIYSNKINLVWYALLSFSFAALSVWVLFFGERSGSLWEQLFIAFTALVTTATTVFLMWAIFRRRPAITIDSNGITFLHLATFKYIPWENIRDVELYFSKVPLVGIKVRGATVNNNGVYIRLRDAGSYVNTLTGFTWLIKTIALRFGSHDELILTDILSCTSKELYIIIKKRLAVYKAYKKAAARKVR